MEEGKGIVNVTPYSVYNTERLEGTDESNPNYVKFHVEDDALGKVDYENYEMKWFKDGHNQDILEGRRLAWYFNKVDSSTDNADKSMTHVIFERFNPSAPQREAFEPTFVQQMMWKHGGASREFVENATLELVNFRSSLPQ